MLQWPSKTAFAVNGPTTGSLYDGTLPPFNWDQFPATPHAGLFQEYNLCVRPWVAALPSTSPYFPPLDEVSSHDESISPSVLTISPTPLTLARRALQ